MDRPRVFIGSSTEGLDVADAVFQHLDQKATAKLWKHQLFMPGRYPLDVLMQEIRRNDFAILVATPDDEVVKRGITSPEMRDNLIFEFGLFSGALGSGRVFFVCPDSPRVDLPSDLLGIVSATYNADRITADASERTSAVHTACSSILEVIRQEWDRRTEQIGRLRNHGNAQAARRLHTVAATLRDTLFVLQRDAFTAFSDRAQFEQVKKRATGELDRVAESFGLDARTVGVEAHLDHLRAVTVAAVLDLPFPEELSAGRERVAGLGMKALDGLLQGGDPLRRARQEAERQVNDTLSDLGRRYAEWWGRHRDPVQAATSEMSDALFNMMSRELT
ncbi:nucleotide-binding protein [Actinoplanes sp. Pm04-4]|uniref:Nucleotide-binding protein n=1 Tax=Paractinoplanes pyxinae TaxID=2997416 RepID=A0ABT4BCP5_9ACTN|nr:nucleotide-binding protein [Actinoplanes pyxinae]MCY1144289.1 nucleotide-binding protein [Actinoplanes pyxinae]